MVLECQHLSEHRQFTKHYYTERATQVLETKDMGLSVKYGELHKVHCLISLRENVIESFVKNLQNRYKKNIKVF